METQRRFEQCIIVDRQLLDQAFLGALVSRWVALRALGFGVYGATEFKNRDGSGGWHGDSWPDCEAAAKAEVQKKAHQECRKRLLLGNPVVLRAGHSDETGNRVFAMESTAMKIHAISDAPSPLRIDFEQFSKELQELSARYDLKMISLGAVATMEAATEGRMYLAVWSAKTNKD